MFGREHFNKFSNMGLNKRSQVFSKDVKPSHEQIIRKKQTNPNVQRTKTTDYTEELQIDDDVTLVDSYNDMNSSDEEVTVHYSSSQKDKQKTQQGNTTETPLGYVRESEFNVVSEELNKMKQLIEEQQKMIELLQTKVNTNATSQSKEEKKINPQKKPEKKKSTTNQETNVNMDDFINSTLSQINPTGKKSTKTDSNHKEKQHTTQSFAKDKQFGIVPPNSKPKTNGSNTISDDIKKLEKELELKKKMLELEEQKEELKKKLDKTSVYNPDGVKLENLEYSDDSDNPDNPDDSDDSDNPDNPDNPDDSDDSDDSEDIINKPGNFNGNKNTELIVPTNPI